MADTEESARARRRRRHWPALAIALAGLLVTAALIVHFVVLRGLPAPPPPETAVADDAYSEPIEAARAALEPLLDHFPSVSVAVGVDGHLVWSEARGWADLRRRIVATPATSYRIYSVSKPITAVAAARLAEQGRLALDAPIGALLTDLPEDVRPITPRQIAGHLSGIRHYREGEISAWGKLHCERVSEALPFFLDREPIVHPPGERHSYSTYGYVLLSRVIEAASGSSYLETLEGLVLRPAGMAGTRLDDPRDELPTRAEFYVPMWLGRVMAEPKGWDNSCKWGAGGLLSTSEDLVRFALAAIGTDLLSAESRELLFTPMKTKDGEETSNGLGFAVGTDDAGVRVALHSGGAMGARSALYLRLDDGIVVALLANLVGDRLTDEASTVAEIFAAHEEARHR